MISKVTTSGGDFRKPQVETRHWLFCQNAAGLLKFDVEAGTEAKC